MSVYQELSFRPKMRSITNILREQLQLKDITMNKFFTNVSKIDRPTQFEIIVIVGQTLCTELIKTTMQS